MSRTFHVGELAIHQLTEFRAPFLPVKEMLPRLTDAMLDLNRGRIGPLALDGTDHVMLEYRSYVVRTPQAIVLIDTGIGNDKDRARPEWHRRSGDGYVRELAEVGLEPADIDIVLCTHLHVDHVGWNTSLRDGQWVPTFPNAEYIFVASELAEAEEKHAADGFPPYVDSILPIIVAGQSRVVPDNYIVNDHVRLEPSHGHTRGHSLVVIGHGSELAVMTGDMFHVALQLIDPDLAFVRDLDPLESSVARRTLFERFCDTTTLICTGHLPSPGVGYLRRDGLGFTLAPPAASEIHEGGL